MHFEMAQNHHLKYLQSSLVIANAVKTLHAKTQANAATKKVLIILVKSKSHLSQKQ
jgi:hypothetical protein